MEKNNQYYEPLLCSRCHTPILHINEVHQNIITNASCFPKKKIKGAFVYLMHDATNNLLKIGFSENPHRRFKEIRNANTNPIDLLGYFEGSKTNEANLHRRWKRYNTKLEWFEYNDDIVDYFKNHPKYIEFI